MLVLKEQAVVVFLVELVDYNVVEADKYYEELVVCDPVQVHVQVLPLLPVHAYLYNMAVHAYLYNMAVHIHRYNMAAYHQTTLVQSGPQSPDLLCMDLLKKLMK